MRAAVDVAVAKPGPVPEQTAVLAGRLRAEPGRAGGLLDGLLALARGRHGVLPGRAVLSLGAVTAGESLRSVRSQSRRPLGEISDGDLVAFLVSQRPTVEVGWQGRS
jgi:hypothetical protein